MIWKIAIAAVIGLGIVVVALSLAGQWIWSGRNETLLTGVPS